jgi:hypothetical protein
MNVPPETHGRMPSHLEYRQNVTSEHGTGDAVLDKVLDEIAISSRR